MSTDRSLLELQAAMRDFAKERDWDQFHSPKNLAAALSVEASEVLEHFQWLSEKESSQISEDKKSKVAFELADVLLYLIRLADRLDIDLADAAAKKIQINSEKYPVTRAKGTARKYTEL